MLRRLLPILFGCLAISGTDTALASSPLPGDSEMLLQSSAMFTNSSATYGNTAYYDTSNSNTDYSFAAGLGFGLANDFEAGFSIGYGRLSAEGCFLNSCTSQTIDDRQWSLFIRHNFTSSFGDSNYAFSGIEVSVVYPESTFGRITMLRPYVGYRFDLPQNWALELQVGAAQVVAGTAEVSSGYEARLGLAIPF